MANAVLVSRIAATAGNAVLISSIKATAATNAVMIGSIRAAVTGAAPVANAGPDQYAVEPWSTVTLTGAASTDDGTITTYAWSQTAGPAVALSGTGATRTFTAPPSMDGSTQTFSLTVTDNTGLISTPDTVVVTVLPATEFMRKNGVWVPCQILRRSGGAWV